MLDGGARFLNAGEGSYRHAGRKGSPPLESFTHELIFMYLYTDTRVQMSRYRNNDRYVCIHESLDKYYLALSAGRA